MRDVLSARCRSVGALALSIALLVSLSVLPATAQDAEPKPRKIQIIRDGYGVPHVYGDSNEDVAYGAGYALAQDRLWQMHVFRHVAKGQLSELLGPIVVDIDKSIRFMTYTEEERAARFEAVNPKLQDLMKAFVAGINTRIDEVNSDPSQLPFEFTEWGEGPPEEWTVDDSIALQDVLILSFGSGGGNELEYAGLLNQLVEKFGEKDGKAAFNDIVTTHDPDGAMTIPREYKYWKKPTYARQGPVSQRRDLEDDARLSLEKEEPEGSDSIAANVPAAARGTLEQLALVPDPEEALRESEWFRRGMEMLGRVFKFGSNAQIAGSKLSENHNSIQTGGPQVGYLLPQWLSDFGMHGGNIDVTGMTFAGAGPAVLIGRGDGYAWTTTTGASDLTDTYVEELNPEAEEGPEYLFNGEFEPMECRTEEYTFRGVPFDEQEICRTRHGPVLAFDEESNKAYSLRYSWFNRETQTIEGFFRYQTVNHMSDFATYSNYLSSNHNMFYTDDKGNFGFWHPGNHVIRERGIDLRLPQDGTGGSEWRGLLPIKKVPHAVNLKRGWLANWNNQPAFGWQRERAYSVIDNANDLYQALNPRGKPERDPFGGLINPDRKLDFEDMSANLRYGAFKEHRDAYFGPLLPDGKLEPIAQKARGVIRSWNGFLTDNNDDGDYDSAGSTILGSWISTMRTELFQDDLGDELVSWGDQNLMWHVLAKNDRRKVKFDWLGESSAAQFRKETFQKTVTALAEEFGNNKPNTWREPAQREHYQRLNADIFTDIVLGETVGNGGDSGFPGDMEDHIFMDRGTYNHIVAYQGAPRGEYLGNVPVKAGSVIPPGQSGFISPTGQEDPHYEDQLELYIDWRYKPMPLTKAEATKLAESKQTIEWTPEEEEG